MTEPPPSVEYSAQCTQWEIFDGYIYICYMYTSRASSLSLTLPLPLTPTLAIALTVTDPDQVHRGHGALTYPDTQP